ncbi:GNAT family N-acetyltransferase [Nocardiopsis sp. MG754419]|nr:GNAT family N-acetyltransferase [Nocardiopsis sp. MG754419]
MEIRTRFPVDDEELSRLHAEAFDRRYALTPWAERLARHSRSWAGVFAAGHLVGFVHAVWDGGEHAFLLDAVVTPALQGRGFGRRVVAALIEDLRERDITWVHVDFEPHLEAFYRQACGFGPTHAGLLRLRADPD